MKSTLEQLDIPKGYVSDTIAKAGAYVMNLHVTLSEYNPYHTGQPYRVPELRVMHVLKGECVFLVNLLRIELHAGDIMFVPAGSVVEIVGADPDIEVRLMASGNESADHTIHIRPSDEDKEDLKALMMAIWRGIRREEEEYVQLLFRAFLTKAQLVEGNHPKEKRLRSEELFTQFVEAVNTYCTKERRIPFYAGQLGLSPHHLSAVIKEASGESAMTWIHRATIQRAKLLLSQGKTALQVSEVLEFPDAPYFNRYFKRHTEMTPGAFQKGKRDR